MDNWETNSQTNADTPHFCSATGQHECEGTKCGDSDANQRINRVCDKIDVKEPDAIDEPTVEELTEAIEEHNVDEPT
jgi:hypothetical protein